MGESNRNGDGRYAVGELGGKGKRFKYVQRDWGGGRCEEEKELPARDADLMGRRGGEERALCFQKILVGSAIRRVLLRGSSNFHGPSPATTPPKTRHWFCILDDQVRVGNFTAQYDWPIFPEILTFIAFLSMISWDRLLLP